MFSIVMAYLTTWDKPRSCAHVFGITLVPEMADIAISGTSSQPSLSRTKMLGTR
jgi:hypothetical protein